MKVCDACGDCFEDAYDFCASCSAGLRVAFWGSRVLCGRYRLEKKLAEGAMGMVFQAVHLAVGSKVAVKVMQPAQKDLQVAVQRFHKEARILGAVKHPHAVLITDFDVDERLGAGDPAGGSANGNADGNANGNGGGPVAFLVTELLRGRSLATLLDVQKTLTIDDVERIVTPLCDALEEAHALGIIHRDLKPSNVFLEKLRDGSEIVKVLDFGIAKLLSRTPIETPSWPRPVDFPGQPPQSTTTTTTAMTAPMAERAETEAEGSLITDIGRRDLRDEILSALDDDGDEPVTRPGSRSVHSGQAAGRGTSTYAGMMVGTIPYMAPEQMTGEHITRRADVHALAVVVFEMLAGRLPFDGDDDDIIRQKLACGPLATSQGDERPSLRELGVDVDVELDALLMRCFALDPLERPESVRIVAECVARAAHGARSGAIVEPIAGLSMRLSTAARALSPLEELPRFDDDDGEGFAQGRDRCRDTLLAAGVSLEKGRAFLPAVRTALSAPPQAQLMSSWLELDDAVAAVREPLSRIALRDVDGGGYLLLLWRRIDAFCQSVGELLEGQGGAVEEGGDLLSAVLDPTPAVHRAPAPLSTLIAALHGKDSLEAADALDALLDERTAEVVRLLSQPGDDARDAADTEAQAEALRAGLWRHADALLLRDVGADRQALRFVPFLAQQAGDNRRFAAVVSALRDRRGAAVVDDVLALPEPRPALRCLLLHPVVATRGAAVAALAVIDLWTVIAHPRTPVSVLRFLFEHLQTRGHLDHLKVFFFCVRESLAGASLPDLKDALGLVRAFFDVSCFHEDLLFEPLLELERGLRARADGAGVLDDSYVRAVAAFVEGGVREEAPLEHLRDVPLPIQRKLAREGRFLSTFVCHNNERVAQETVQHLLRLEDITRFLRMVTIHRVVLVELAKRRRLFKKDGAKLALLCNPKTPAIMARPFLSLLGDEQLRQLSTNRQINPDVRRLILQALAR